MYIFQKQIMRKNHKGIFKRELLELRGDSQGKYAVLLKWIT